MDRQRELPPVEGRPPATPDESEAGAHTPIADRTDPSNSPRTTDGDITAPKFGGADRGGAELAPGATKD